MKKKKNINYFNRLLKNRTVHFFGNYNETIEILKYLELKDNKKEINLFILFIGGVSEELFALLDTIDLLKCKVNTVGLGKAYSAGALLLISGTGTRSVTKRTGFTFSPIEKSIDELSCENQKINEKDLINYHKMIRKIIKKNCKNRLNKEEVEEILKRDSYISPREAIRLGLIDKIEKKAK